MQLQQNRLCDLAHAAERPLSVKLGLARTGVLAVLCICSDRLESWEMQSRASPGACSGHTCQK